MRARRSPERLGLTDATSNAGFFVCGCLTETAINEELSKEQAMTKHNNRDIRPPEPDSRCITSPRYIFLLQFSIFSMNPMERTLLVSQSGHRIDAGSISCGDISRQGHGHDQRENSSAKRQRVVGLCSEKQGSNELRTG